jgi:hypothetical protein
MSWERNLSSLRSKDLELELRSQGINFDINEVLAVFEAETDGGKKTHMVPSF